MARTSFFGYISKRVLIIVLTLIALACFAYYLWQKNKYHIVTNKLQSQLLTETDSLYHITFDSLYFDEINGEAYMKNIRVIPDTARAMTFEQERQPYTLLDISATSLKIKGVKTAEALQGSQMIGDSIIISDPVINMYFLKKVRKETKIEREATSIYKQILGKLRLIQVGKVIVNNVNLTAQDLKTKVKDFEARGANLQLYDVKIDSLHDRDTSRTLYCKQAYFNVQEFKTYNNGRPEATVNNLVFRGKEKQLAVEKFSIIRYADKIGKGELLADMNNFICTGLHTNEFVKNKQMIVDSIWAGTVTFYRQAGFSNDLKGNPGKKNSQDDTTGFTHAYSLAVEQLYFPNILIKESPSLPNKKNLELGQISVKIRNVVSDELAALKDAPFSHCKEINLNCRSLALTNITETYKFNFSDMNFNSRTKTMKIGKFSFLPTLPESQFAQHAGTQRDRYEIRFSDAALINVDLDKLMQNQVLADQLVVNNSMIKIYRDLTYPLEQISKVGGYPHQMLLKAKMPINIRNGVFNNSYIEYMEKNPLSDSSGKVKLIGSKIVMSNVTNIPSVIATNRYFNVSFTTKILGKLPMQSTIRFDLLGKNGEFNINGKTGGCDARSLNVIARPMALIEIDTGFINQLSFNLNGNNYETNGDVELQYQGVKVKLLKVDETTKKYKRKGVMSIIANAIIKNDNPHKGDLRSYTVQYDRDIYKSFFNLIWKSIFVGIQETMGFPKSKLRNVKRK